MMSTEIRSILNRIASLGREMGVSQIVLYGSRARGDHRERSDIDIAVYGLEETAETQFLERIDQLPTLLHFDVVFVTDQTDGTLLENIKKDGIPLMGKFSEKYGKLAVAVDRLAEGVAEYERRQSDVVRDGVIQRFEFCVELAWKTAREYLLEQGYADLNSPKSVMRQAYADGLVNDGDTWVTMLNDCNLTSHLYDEATAAAIFSRIAVLYLPMLRGLFASLSEK